MNTNYNEELPTIVWEELDSKRKRDHNLATALLVFACLIISAVIVLGVILFSSYSKINRAKDDYKTEVKYLVNSVLNGDGIGCESVVAYMDACTDTMRSELDRSIWGLPRILDSVGEDLDKADDLLTILENVSANILHPLVQTVKDHPLDNLKLEKESLTDAANIDTLSAYIDFYKDVKEPVRSFVSDFSDFPEFSIGKLEDTVSKYREPVKLAGEALPAIDRAVDNVAVPLLELVKDNPIELPDKIELEWLSEDNCLTIQTYAHAIAELYPDIMTTLKDVREIELPDKLKDNEKVASLLGKAADIENLLKAADGSFDSIILPAVDALVDAPPALFKNEDHFNVNIINALLDMVEGIQPELASLRDDLAAADISSEKLSGTVTKVTEAIDKVNDLWESAGSFLPVVRQIIGDGSDKLYILACQNSAEIRPSGGFPGSVAFINIKDGWLFLDEFMSIYDIMYYRTPRSAKITSTEEDIFGMWLYNPWDAGFDPHFPRVCEIWQAGLEEKCGITVDGYISLTPAIVQEMMQFVDPITLSDGTVIDATNTTKVLQHDIYYNYFTEETKKMNEVELDEVNQEVDALFAEAAKSVLFEILSNLKLDNVKPLLDIVEESRKDRVLMIWMADEDAQEVIEEYGFDGGLNDDPEHPEVGIFFGNTDPSKLGWFVDMTAEIGEAEYNEKDDTNSYEVTIVIKNTIEKSDLSSHKYILGSYRGSMRMYLHLFSPADGSLSNVDATPYEWFQKNKYKGLVVRYVMPHMIDPGKEFTVTFTVTTAPGVKEKPVIVMTPTLQKYREASEY